MSAIRMRMASKRGVGGGGGDNNNFVRRKE